MPPTDYQLIVIGGGSGGLVAAVGAAMFGARVALIDKREMLGGDCLNFGCVPSKALIRAARAAQELRNAGRFGLPGFEGKADLETVMSYVRGKIAHIAVHDDAERFRKMGIDVFLGEHARFIDAHTLVLGERTLSARKFIIATGSGPVMPLIPGLTPRDYFDNESVFYKLNSLPERLLVVGGGPIGCELGQAFQRLGSQVTLLQRGDRLIEKEEPEASAVVADTLRAEGMTVALSTSAAQARREGDRWVVTLQPTGGAPYDETFDAVLGAAGRRPGVDAMGLEFAGVKQDSRGFITVDDTMATNVRHIYAVGDVVGKFAFTHMAEAEAKIALRNALFPGWARMNYAVVPWATFTEPEVGRVGARESELVASGTPHRVFTFNFSEADRAITDDATDGFIKLLTTPKGKLLGATIVGAQAGELIHEYVLAMHRGLSLGDLSAMIHVYPTLTLANRRAADLFLREKLNSPGGRLLRWWVGR